MNRKELEKIVENLDTVFRGDAWHGPSMMEIINSLPQEVVDQKQNVSKHSISELIFHLYAWRKFILEKLNDNITFSLETEAENWGTASETSAEKWPELVANLKSTHELLIAKLEQLDDSILENRVAGEHYDFYTLLTGLIQHDTYHLGMIWVLWQ